MHLSPRPPQQPSRITVELDAAVIESLDRLLLDYSETLNCDRTKAIEAAIQEWCKRQEERQQLRAADYHRQRHEADETGWLV